MIYQVMPKKDTVAPEKGKRWRGRKRWGRNDKPQKEFSEVLLEVRRVTRVTTWWRQLAFRAIILVWNKKGKIGIWVSKGNDVSIAVRKATHEAYKNVIQAPITDSLSVPYTIMHKYKSAIVKLIPASSGTWLKAWSSVRTVLELTWYSNILSKIVGTNNKLNNATAAIQALSMYKIWKNPKIQFDWKKDTDPKESTSSISNKLASKSSSKDSWESSKNNWEKADDLTKIEWIGPKICSLLVDAWIRTYVDLAKASPKVLSEILIENKLWHHEPTTRPKQSKMAADWKRDELQKRQDELDWWKE